MYNESLASDIPAGYRKIANLFTVYKTQPKTLHTDRTASVGMKLHFHILPSTDGNCQSPRTGLFLHQLLYVFMHDFLNTKLACLVLQIHKFLQETISTSHILYCLYRTCSVVFSTLVIMDQISTKTPNPKCRLYWCLTEFID